MLFRDKLFEDAEGANGSFGGVTVDCGVLVGGNGGVWVWVWEGGTLESGLDHVEGVDGEG